LARYQSAAGNRVTNLRNETVDLDDLDRHVLLRLDGTRNLLDVVEMLVALVEQGSLRIDEKDRPAPSAARVRALLESAVGRVLPKLASLALLIDSWWRERI
jgi:methyltransferase-like protein